MEGRAAICARLVTALHYAPRVAVSGGSMALHFEHGGKSGALIRSSDWSETSLGAIGAWPVALKTTVSTMLGSPHPMCLWWGEERWMFCNDACIPLLSAERYSAICCQPWRTQKLHPWEKISAQIDDAMREVPSWHENACLPIERNGMVEDAYWTYGFSPVHDEHGITRGVLSVFTETTAQVLKAQRMEALHMVLSELTKHSDIDHALCALVQVATTSPADLPFLIVYRRGRNDATHWEAVAASAGVSGQHVDQLSDAVKQHALTGDNGQAQQLLKLLTPVLIEGGAQPVVHAAIAMAPSIKRHAFVFGVHPRRHFDADMRAFFDLIVSQVDLAIARLAAVRERTLVEAERRALLMQAPFPVSVMVGPSLIYELANPAYLAFTGHTDLIGRPWSEVFPELQGTPADEAIRNVYATGIPFVASEFVVTYEDRRHGTVREACFNLTLQPIRDANDEITGVMGIAVEVTDQVNARHVVERSILELEGSLIQKQGLVAQLEASSRAKDDFLALVSHELRTPLTSILGWARVLQTTRDATRLDKGLRVIERNAVAQATLIDEMLDISRIIAGHVRVTLRAVDPLALANAAMESVRPLVNAKSIRLLAELDPSLTRFVADQERMQQILWHLLSNAVKFTPHNGVISLRVMRDGDVLVFSVQDSGQGITPEFLPHVFERFSQTDGPTHAGLGLGLAIVLELVRLHGGTITAHSEGKGLGARFEVRLPMDAKPTLETDPLPLSDVQPEPMSRHTLHDLHVLVVEDEDDTRDFIATVLNDAGAQVTQIDSALQALTMLREDDFHVLVSDIGMPAEDGYALIERVRAPSQPLRIRGMPALAVTAFTGPEDRRRALASGYQDHLAKPIDPNTLVQRVAALAER